MAVPWEVDFSLLLNNVLKESANCSFMIPGNTGKTFFLCVINFASDLYV